MRGPSVPRKLPDPVPRNAERSGISLGYANFWYSDFHGLEGGELVHVSEPALATNLGGIVGPSSTQMIVDWLNPDGLGSFGLYSSEKVGGVRQLP